MRGGFEPPVRTIGIKIWFIFCLGAFPKISRSMEKTFIRVRSVTDIVVDLLLIVFGGVLIALPTSPSINITGFLMICAGIILTLALKTGYKDEETGETYLKREHYFQHAMSEQIAAAIASRPNSIDLSAEDKGNSMRMDVYFSKSTNKAYIQLHEYIPYRYEPCSKMYEYELSKVNKLIS